MYTLDASKFQKKQYYKIENQFEGVSPEGKRLDFTNYYMRINERPFFGISGEFHFSRMDESRWEDEIIKMKMAGINVVSTYIFWIHHEEIEGEFCFEGSKNLRHFVELCHKHGLYVIVRIGPFDHGEVRNGGLPDWLYGKPFEVRKLNDGFLFYTRRLYQQIAGQLDGLYYQDGGPIIAAQIDNEYMHSSAPWEMTTGISGEWIFGGDDGEAYMLALMEMAKECGIVVPFYTCTGWGGAITPKECMPLWGGYAYRPWLFYDGRGEHPSTEEYVYQDFHNKDADITNDFDPSYDPETRPYACCEMGGGMMNTYYYRFILPYESVDAMANIKMASGCNFLGYYVFQGGTNPASRNGVYLNEGQVPKMSYDYQAAIGEFGQIRPSYQRLKTLHYFCMSFGDRLCQMQTVLPEGASRIEPKDLDTLRYALRWDGNSGFLFINNFQDHEEMPAKKDERIDVVFDQETITFDQLSIAGGENAILPIHLDLDGIDLVRASAQPVTRQVYDGQITYVFMRPEGMKADFLFEEGAVTDQGSHLWRQESEGEAEVFTVRKGEKEIRLLLMSRELASQMYVTGQGLIFSKDAILEDENGIRLETRDHATNVLSYPAGLAKLSGQLTRAGIFDQWHYESKEKQIDLELEQVAEGRYTIGLPENMLEGIKDVLLRISYAGDIGMTFLDGAMVTDHFCNGDVWEIGLATYGKQLKDQLLTLLITPLKKGASVNVESAMAARMESYEESIARLDAVEAVVVYEFVL